VKLVSVVALFSVLMLALASFASGAAPSALKTFGEESGSIVTVTGSKSATIVNEVGEYGGVYVQGKSLNGKALAKVDFEFTSTDAVAGGAPRFSMPIDDGTTTLGYAFVDVLNCATSHVSTDDASCKVYFKNEVHANWDAFATAHSTWKIASAIPFIIADQPGTYSVTSIDLH
jgi:hypothetical protein